MGKSLRLNVIVYGHTPRSRPFSHQYPGKDQVGVRSSLLLLPLFGASFWPHSDFLCGKGQVNVTLFCWQGFCGVAEWYFFHEVKCTLTTLTDIRRYQ